MNRNVINFEQYKNLQMLRHIKEYPDRYEYSVQSQFAEQRTAKRVFSIQMDQCFANVIKRGNKYEMISIVFFKEKWTVDEIIQWIQRYKIEIFSLCYSPLILSRVNKIIDAKKFNGVPIILTEIGVKTFIFDTKHLIEVTESYARFDEISPTAINGNGLME